MLCILYALITLDYKGKVINRVITSIILAHNYTATISLVQVIFLAKLIVSSI